MQRSAALACLALAACAGGGQWSKPGSDAAATAQEVADCRAVAGNAAASDQGIDQDILASRGPDWARARTLPNLRQDMQDQDRQHVDAVISACMRAKGFTKPS